MTSPDQQCQQWKIANIWPKGEKQLWRSKLIISFSFSLSNKIIVSKQRKFLDKKKIAWNLKSCPKPWKLLQSYQASCGSPYSKLPEKQAGSRTWGNTASENPEFWAAECLLADSAKKNTAKQQKWAKPNRSYNLKRGNWKSIDSHHP